MSIATEIARLQQAKADLKASIIAKGGTITDETIDEYAGFVDNLPLPKEEETKTLEPDFSGGNQIITPTGGKVMTSVTLTKPTDLLPENIAKDKNVCGVVGTSFIVVELTQAEYDALGTKDANTYYLITEE